MGWSESEKVAWVRIGGVGDTYHCVPSRTGVGAEIRFGVLLGVWLSPKVRSLGGVVRARKLRRRNYLGGCRRL